MIIDPRGTTVVEWTDRMSLDLSEHGLIPRLDHEANWREWGMTVNLLPGISARNPPSPHDYTDWVEWAERFNQMVWN